MSDLMRAVAQLGQAYSVGVIDVPRPQIVNETDVVVRVNATAICGSDLHTYHTTTGSENQPYLFGHEAIGYVAEVGKAVQFLNVGDYVVIPDNTDHGHFSFAPEHYIPNEPISYGGLQDSGALPGVQAEYAYVPFGDQSLIPVPLNHSSNSSALLDYLFVSDIFATAWQGVSWSGFEPGDTVAVFGAGPVGLLAAHSAIIRGASKVYSVDRVQDRLDLAASIGAIPINFSTSDPVQQILAHEPGGVRRGVDCVGFEAENAAGEIEQGIVLRNLLNVTANRGGIGIVGLYNDNQTTFDIGRAFNNGISVHGGVVLPLEVAPEIVPLITSGVAKPSFIISSLIGIEDAPEYYARFNRREESKVVIRF